MKPLGTGLKNFSNEVKDVDPDAIYSAAKAAKALALMNDYIPNQGGLVSLIAGDNTFSDFADGLKPLGEGLRKFSDEVEDVDPENVSQAAKAAKALAEMADIIPNQGGLVAWFTGDNSISSFADDLLSLAEGLSDFSDEVEDIKPKSFNAAVEAAKSLAEMADTIPNQGGVAAWFAGDNSISSFAEGLSSLGRGLSDFSDEVEDIKPKNVEAAAKAAKALAEMADTIPNKGGLVSKFAGDNDISGFGEDLSSLGRGLSDFSDEVEDIKPSQVQAAADAAKTLAEMIDDLPGTGFFSKLFSSDADVEGFADDLSSLGAAIAKFDESVDGINSKNIDAASKAAETLADIKDKLSSGDGDDKETELKILSSFAKNLQPFGEALYDFSYEVEDINVKKVKTAADAALSLSKVVESLPKTTGEKNENSRLTSLTKFVGELEPFGEALYDFSSEVEDINSKKVLAATDVAGALTNAVNKLPKPNKKKNEGTKLDSLVTFVNNLQNFGKALYNFSSEVEDINSKKALNAADVAVSLAKAVNQLPKTTGKKDEKSVLTSLTTFIDNLKPLGQGIINFNNQVDDIKDFSKVKSAADAAVKLSGIINKMPETTGKENEKSQLTSLTAFIKNLEPLGKGIGNFNEKVADIKTEKVNAAANAAVKLSDIISKMPKSKKGDDSSADKNYQLNALSTFIKNLEPLGKGIGDFNDKVEDLKTEKVNAAANAAVKLSGLIKQMPETSEERGHYANNQLRALATFTGELQPLGVAIGDFNTAVEDINANKVNAAANVAVSLSKLVDEMPETTVDDDKTDQLDSLSKFTDKLKPLGVAIGDFNAEVADINANKVTAATTAATNLAKVVSGFLNAKEANSIMLTSEDLQNGNNPITPLAKFVSALKPLGTAIKGFNDEVSDINATKVTTATNTAKTLAELVSNMPDGSKLPKDQSSNDENYQLRYLSGFVKELKPLGVAINDFNNSVGKINVDIVKGAADAALTLAKIVPLVSNAQVNIQTALSPGTMSNFPQLTVMTGFIGSLKPLGVAINDFNSSVGQIDGKKALNAADVSVKLADVVNDLPDKISKVATQLEKPFSSLGKAVNSFYTNVKDVGAGQVKAVAGATKNLGKAVDNLPTGKDISSFNTNIETLGTKLKSFASTVTGINTKNLSSAVASLNKTIDDIVKAAKDGASKVAKAFDNKTAKNDMTTAIKSLLDAGKKKISSYNDSFKKTGEGLASRIGTGMSSKKDSVSKNAKSLVSSAVSGIKEKYDSFKSSGSYLGSGLIVGINDKQQEVYDAGYALGKKAAKGVKDGEKVNSPSKLTIEYGKSLGEGLMVGMDRISDSVYKSSYAMGNKAATSMSSTVSKLADSINTDIDSQPTIRPVVDLSDVSASAGSINKMFDVNPSVGVMSNVRAINASMNEHQNGNYELLSAINGLRKDMSSSDNSNPNITVNLDYKAGTDANEIANDIATSLRRAIRRGV